MDFSYLAPCVQKLQLSATYVKIVPPLLAKPYSGNAVASSLWNFFPLDSKLNGGVIECFFDNRNSTTAEVAETHIFPGTDPPGEEEEQTHARGPFAAQPASKVEVAGRDGKTTRRASLAADDESGKQTPAASGCCPESTC